MEMKRKQTHILNRHSSRGFTIVELLVAMVVSLLALAAIYSTFQSQHRSYQVQRETSEMQQNIRTAMFYMEREIRMAGSNPFNSLPLSNFGITANGQNTITFTEDITGPPVGSPVPVARPDGFITFPNEDITYTLNGTDLVRTDNNVAPPNNSQIVAQNIDWLNFVYLKDDGTVATTLADIRSVEITIVARTNDPLLYGTANNNTYWNQRQGQTGAASWVAPGDSVSRRRLTTLIHCRNLGL